MIRLAVLGSTGSVGTQTLDVARWRGYRVVGLAAGGNAELLIRQALEFLPELVSCDARCAEQVRSELPASIAVSTNSEDVAALDADVVMAAIPGTAGLRPTARALESGRRVALAHKEAMVIAGPLVWEVARRHGTEIITVDSEHSALLQCLAGEDKEAVERLVLTASGGPFREEPEDLSRVTPQQALQHPNWSMGHRITVDSATLFNKGLELLEAHFLFGMPLEKIEVLIHPQQLVHGLVRFADGSIKAQIGPHDMRLPIQYAIEYPDRPPVPLAPLSLAGRWDFFEPDVTRFPSLRLAREAGQLGGVAPAALNAADEVAVEAFLAGRARFTDIAATLEHVLERVPAQPLDWRSLAEADAQARQLAASFLQGEAVPGE
ncbi:MAG TPA: 1-deoxy-D-xylulose-5-phosphate reductoisomerase [Trueperaceae bacterium]